MNAKQHEHMMKTGEAPCGCHVVFEGNMQTVHHDCMPNRQAESDAANEKSAREHAERQERNMLLHTIPLDVLRGLFAQSGEVLQERKAKKKEKASARA